VEKKRLGRLSQKQSPLYPKRNFNINISRVQKCLADFLVPSRSAKRDIHARFPRDTFFGRGGVKSSALIADAGQSPFAPRTGQFISKPGTVEMPSDLDEIGLVFVCFILYIITHRDKLLLSTGLL
jgi:hypothetical protein